MLKVGPHPPAGRGADHARPGVRRVGRVRGAWRGRRRARGGQLLELNLGATALGTGLNAGDDFTRRRRRPGALHRPCRRPCAQPVSRHAEHGRRRRVSGAVRRLAIEAGKVASDLRLLAWGRAPGSPRSAAGGAARLVDHAGQSEPVGAGDGQPGLLPGDWLRHDDCRRRRRRPARAQRHDAGDRLERAACLRILTQALIVLRIRTIEGLEADADRCRELLDRSTAVATALSPYLGYATTAEIAKAAVATNRSIRISSSSAGSCPPIASTACCRRRR